MDAVILSPFQPDAEFQLMRCKARPILSIDYLIQIQYQIPDHGPGGQFLRSQSGVRLAFAHADQLLGGFRIGLVARQVFLESFAQDRHLDGIGQAAGEAAEQVLEAGIGVSRGLLECPLGQGPGSLDEELLVHQKQGLQRGIGAFAADGAGLARGSIEGAHLRRVGGAFQESVQAAAVDLSAAAIGPEDSGVAAGESDGFP